MLFRSGYYGKVQLNDTLGYSPCTSCPMNYYCNGGNQISVCPPGTMSAPNSVLSGCITCPLDLFCYNGQIGSCPVNSKAPQGSSSISACVCNPGYYGLNGDCTLCEVGFYCPGGAIRLACTDNAISTLGSYASWQCFCSRGYYSLNNTPCTVCPEGYWCWTEIGRAHV